MVAKGSDGTSYPRGEVGARSVGHLPRIKRRMDHQRCSGRVWIFLILGLVLMVFSVVILGIYFNSRSVTTSTQHVEVLPTYVTAVMAGIAGLSVVILFWKRHRVLVFVAVVTASAAGLICGITGVLTYTHVVRPLRSITTCRYYSSQDLCQCFSPYKRDMLSIHYSGTELTKYDFENVADCDVVQEAIPQLLYTLIATYALILLVTIASVILALLVLRIETHRRRGFFEDEAYEEVYTVSGTSSRDQSDSETEVKPKVVHSPVGQCQGQSYPSLSASHSKSALLMNTPVTSTKRERSFSNFQREATPDSVCTTNSAGIRADDLRRNSFANSKRLSKSCESLDFSERIDSSTLMGNINNNNSKVGNVTEGDNKKKGGRLKEHRRRGRRAVTLHNLDTNQLMLILDLQMRYLQETKEIQSKSQQNISSAAKTAAARRSVSPPQNAQLNPRRAITPQPTTHQSVIPPGVRSHTPQPYRSNNQRQRAQQEQSFYAQFGSLPVSGQISPDSFYHSVGGHSNHSPSPQVQGQGHNYSQGHRTTPTMREGKRGESPYLNPENVHIVAYDDNMLNIKGSSKPKSRASVQKYSLPDQPLHRHNKDPLPPKPLSRQRSSEQALPPEPIHRGKSAFHVVDPHRNKSRSPSVSSDKTSDSPLPFKHRRGSKGSDLGDTAIRDNFRMRQSPFMLQHSVDSAASDQSPHSSNKSVLPSHIPPYSSPPSYDEFVRTYDHNTTSSTSSNPEEMIYSKPQPKLRPHQRQRQHHHSAGDRESTPHQELPNYNLDSNQRLEFIYGNAENVSHSTPQPLHHHHQQQQQQQQQQHYHRGQGQDQRVRGHSTPPRSRVKQSIVPEDYYAQVEKRAEDRVVYANPDKGHGDSSSHQLGQRRGHNMPVGGAMYQTPPPKFHEYEDVYDTPDQLPQDIVTTQERRGQTYGDTVLTSQNNDPRQFEGHNIEQRSLEVKGRNAQVAYTPGSRSGYIPHQNQQIREPVDGVGEYCLTGTQPKGQMFQGHPVTSAAVPAIKLNDEDEFADDEVFVEDTSVQDGRIKNAGSQDKTNSFTPGQQPSTDSGHVDQTGSMAAGKTFPVSSHFSNRNVNQSDWTGNQVTGSALVRQVPDGMDTTVEHAGKSNDREEVPDSVAEADDIKSSLNDTDYCETGV